MEGKSFHDDAHLGRANASPASNLSAAEAKPFSRVQSIHASQRVRSSSLVPILTRLSWLLLAFDSVSLEHRMKMPRRNMFGEIAQALDWTRRRTCLDLNCIVLYLCASLHPLTKPYPLAFFADLYCLATPNVVCSPFTSNIRQLHPHQVRVFAIVPGSVGLE